MTKKMIKYNNLIKKEISRRNFIEEKNRQERNNFGIKTYKVVEDPVYDKIVTDLDNISNQLRKRLNIVFA